MAGNLNDSPAYRGRKIRGHKLGGSRPRSSSDICRGSVPIFDLDSRMIRRRGGEQPLKVKAASRSTIEI